MSWPRAGNWESTFLAGTSSSSSIRSISRLVRTSLATSRQSTFADTLPGSRSATVVLGPEGGDHGGRKSVDLVVAHADDVEAAAVGHVDRVIAAQLEHLILAQRKHREHPVLPPDEGQ